MILRRRAVGAVLVAAALTGTAACGTHLDANGKKAAGNLSRAFQGAGFNAKDGDCLAQGWVSRAGTDTLVGAGILSKDLSVNPKNSQKPDKDVVAAYVTSYFDCVDYGKYEAIKFDQERPGLINKTSFAACADKVDQDQARQALTDDLLGKSTTVSQAVQHELISCATGE